MTICKSLLSLCQVNAVGPFHACIPASVWAFLHPSLRQILCSAITSCCPHSYIIYIPSSDLNLIPSYYFFSGNFIVVMIFFFLYSAIQFSILLLFHTLPILLLYFPAFWFSFLQCSSIQQIQLILLSSSFLRTIMMFATYFFIFQISVFKNLILCSLVFSLANWPSFLRLY